MVAGLTIFNDSNHIQIDDRIKTISLIKARDSSPIDISKEMVALSVKEYHHRQGISDARGLPMYVFSLQPQPNQSNYGLEIFDKDGGSAFHSGSFPLRVVHYMEINTYTSDAITHQVPNVGKLGYVISGYRQGELMRQNGMSFNRYKGHVKIEIIDNNTIKISPIWEYKPARLGFARCELCLRLLLVDLGGYSPTLIT